MAGVIDSSSYMTIKRANRIQLTPLITVSTSVGVMGMGMLKDSYGGYTNRGRLIMNPGSVWRLLNDVYPFLMDKREHAEVLLAFKDSMERFRTYKLGKPPSTELPDGERAIREVLWQRLQKLNLNGTDPSIT